MQKNELHKNLSEKIRISIEDHHGHKFCCIQVYAKNNKGKWTPTQNRINIKPDLLGDVIEELIAVSERLEGLS